MNHTQIIKFLFLLLLTYSTSIVAFAQDPVLNETKSQIPFTTGVDFFSLENRDLDSLDSLEQLQQVVDIEVYYWFGCAACQQVEKALADFVKRHPDLKVKRTPLVAYLSWRQQAYLQPVLSQLQILLPEIELPSNDELYQACLADCSVFSSYENVLLWLKQKLQLTELPQLNEAAIWQAEKDFRKRAESHSISQVPTIIIRESYSVDANSAKNVGRMIDIVDYLLKAANP